MSSGPIVSLDVTERNSMFNPTPRPPRRGLFARLLPFALAGSLILSSLSFPASCPAQFQPVFRAISDSPGVPGNNGLGGLIIASRTRTRALRQAQDYIANQKYVEAVGFLQTLLELDQDQLLPPAADDKTGVFRSLKTEIQHIIGHLPPEGREVYLRNTSPAADALLKEALEQNDSQKLGQVARLYFHTPAGYEATYQIAIAEVRQRGTDGGGIVVTAFAAHPGRRPPLGTAALRADRFELDPRGHAPRSRDGPQKTGSLAKDDRIELGEPNPGGCSIRQGSRRRGWRS